MIRRTALAALAAVLLMLGLAGSASASTWSWGSRAAAVKTQTLGPTSFVYTTDSASAQVAGAAARGWSHGTVADIKKTTSCAGAHCMHIETIVGPTLCGTDRVACGWWNPDGSFLIQIETMAYDLNGSDAYALALTKHEMGHGLGLPHSDDPTSIMYLQVGPSSDITDQDRANLNAILGA